MLRNEAVWQGRCLVVIALPERGQAVRHRGRIGTVLAATLLTLGDLGVIPPSAHAANAYAMMPGIEALGADPRAVSVEQRAAFGLPVDAATIDRLLAGEGAGGLGRIGILMTEQEERFLDIPGREAWQAALDKQLIPYAMNLPSYGGMWFDQRRGGLLTISLTDGDPATREAITRLLPPVSRGLEFASARISNSRLKDASLEAAQVWDGLKGAPSLLSMAVDTRANGLSVGVLQHDQDQAKAFAEVVSRAVNVPISIRSETIGIDTACTSRDNCSNPLKPGIRLAKGDTTVDDCTMAFHIDSGGATGRNFVTAGHCGFVGNNCWYHQGYNGPNGRRVGCELDGRTLLGPDGHDIMAVGMFDDQATEQIYGTTINQLVGWAVENSHLGAVVKASRGHSDNISTGTITNDWISWISDKGGNVRVWGLDTDIPSNPGDSGSPVFTNSDAGWEAVGTLSNALGRVTYFDSCWDHWGSFCFLYG